MLRKRFSDREFYRRLMSLTLPIALQSLMLALVAAADALMLGGQDQNSMAAVSLATQIQFVQNMILAALTGGTGILGAQYWGKGDRRALSDIFFLSLRLAAVTDVLFFVGCVFFPKLLMTLFTNDAELITIGIRYLRLAGWSYLMTGISQTYLTLLKVSDRAGQTAKISTVTVLLNIALNAVFIFGLLGAPKMGVRGAALATLSARVVELLWAVGAVQKKGGFHPDYRRLFARSRVLAKDFSKCTVPILFACVSWGVGFTAYTAFIGHLGADAAAANSVASVVRDLVCCLCNGIANGGGIMVGNALGAGDLETGKRYGIRVMKLSFVCGGASTLIMLLLTPLIMLFVKLDEGATQYLLGMMVIMAVYMIGRAVNTVIINGIFSAGGDTKFDLYSLAVMMWGVAVPLAALGTFVFDWPVLAVYACTCLDEVGKIPWVMLHFRKYKWVKDLTRDREKLEEA